MKLYTEEQVRQAIELTYLVELYGIRDIKYRYTPDEVVEKLTPIELPGDEEIDEKSNFLFPIANRIGGSTYIAHKSFIEGAKWMRDKILNK